MDAEARGDRARQILESDVFQEAAAKARQRLMEEWTRTKNADIRESLWQQYQATEAITRELMTIRNNGVVERTKREKKEK